MPIKQQYSKYLANAESVRIYLNDFERFISTVNEKRSSADAEKPARHDVLC